MSKLAKAHPDDTEAHDLLRARARPDGAADRQELPNLLAAGAMLEPLFARQPDHPGVAHYIIHAYDVPPLAPKALAAARRYAEIAPSAPHALHMPSHTFTRVGAWQESIDANLAIGRSRAPRARRKRRDARDGLSRVRVPADRA